MIAKAKSKDDREKVLQLFLKGKSPQFIRTKLKLSEKLVSKILTELRKASLIGKYQKPHTQEWYRKQCVKFAKKLVKERDEHTCQMCGKSRNDKTKEGKPYQMQVSHVYPEWEFKQLSDEPINLKVLCSMCHMKKWHESPIEGARWYQDKFRDSLEILDNLVRVPEPDKDWKERYHWWSNRPLGFTK